MTYPWTDLSQVAAVHLLSPGHAREGKIDLSPGAGEHLVTKAGLLGRLTKLEGGLDLPHVGQLGADAVRLQDRVDHVVRLEEGASDGPVAHLAVHLIHTHSAKVTGNREKLVIMANVQSLTDYLLQQASVHGL